MTFNSYERTASVPQKFGYGGKEVEDWRVQDFGWRRYEPELGRWHAIDPSADNYESWTPYNYVANNPLLLIDPFGTDWFYYRKEGEEDASWNWHDGSEYNHSYSYTDEGGNEQSGTILLQGVEAVVEFDGTGGENLGEGDNLYGDGATLANVTVYGPGGANDIQTYEGYTKSSNEFSYGFIADGIYSGNYDEQGKSGSLTSNWTLNNRGNVPMFVPSLNPNTAFSNPNLGTTFGTPIKNGIFIHRSNLSGFAGGNVSTGCLLIAPGRGGNGADWNRFNNQMEGVTNFAVQVKRGYNYSISDSQGKVLFQSSPRFWSRPLVEQ